MKLNSKRDKRNYIIIALCMILVVMGVGYAAFSSMLTINGTANISNSWCLGFDNSKTNAYEITKGVSTGEAPTGTMTYSGDVCSTNLVPHSNLTAVFHQPGDQIEYTLTIKNASTVTAAIKSIKVDNQNITGNTTKTKGNITFTINFPLKTTLTSNETTTMTIIAKFQNETDVTGSFAGSESQTISVELNGEQDDGNGGIVPETQQAFTGILYSTSSDSVSVGDSAMTQGWCGLDKGDYNSCSDDGIVYNSEDECLDDFSSCIVGMGYYKYSEEIPNGAYLKHNIVNGIVQSTEACLDDGNGLSFCLKPNEYSTSQNTLNTAFGTNNCLLENGVYSCYKNNNYFLGIADTTGLVKVANKLSGNICGGTRNVCTVLPNSSANCSNETYEIPDCQS